MERVQNPAIIGRYKSFQVCALRFIPVGQLAALFAIGTVLALYCVPLALRKVQPQRNGPRGL
jgi:hypothetical protein